MKKIFLILFFLILIAAIAIAVFIATFDANRYKSTIEEKIGQAIGRPVEIGSLALKFRNGLALQVDGIQLGQSASAEAQQISFQAERFFLKLETAPLLKKEIQISECLLESPKIVIENTGRASAGAMQETSPQSNVNNPVKVALPPEISDFQISKIVISNGTFTYRDLSARPPSTILLEKLSLELRNVSLKSPIQFKASGEVLFGETRYFSAEGTFSYPQSSLELAARVEQSIQLSGALDNVLSIPSGTLKIKVDHLDLSTFLTPEQKRGEYFTGILSADLTASARGMQVDELKRSLNSAGYVVIDSGALKNKNLLRENLQRITQIPGIGALFQINLGPRFDALLQNSDTQFDQFKANFKASNSTVLFQSIELTHQDYAMGLNGSATFDSVVDFKGSLVIQPQLSEAMIKKVKELSLILDREGQLVIPFLLRGRVPGAVPQPDLGNLAARTIETVGTELLEKGLTKLLKPKNSEESSSQQPQPQS